MFSLFFFFNDTATTEIYTLSLHDALPIFSPRALPGTWVPPVSSPEPSSRRRPRSSAATPRVMGLATSARRDRKSTRLNSSHSQISYAVFCLKKKRNNEEWRLVG